MQIAPLRTLSRIATATAAIATVALLVTTSKPQTALRSRSSKRPTDQARSFAMHALATPPGEQTPDLPRRLLALYDSSETTWAETNEDEPPQVPIKSGTSQLHRLAELPINHLGLVVDYLDVASAELPDASTMARYRGVVTWFQDDTMPGADVYLRWLLDQARQGVRLVVLERLGARYGPDGAPVDTQLVDKAFAALGARHTGNATDDSSAIKLAWFDPELLGFERAMPARLPYFEGYTALPGARIFARLERTDRRGAISDAAFTSDAGGFVAPGLVMSEDRLGERYVRRWLLNPFEFFSRALDVADWPRPDFTTKNGKRLFYSHIDGDGLEMITELDYKTRCGAVVRDQIFRGYALPFTASVVVGLTAPPPIGKGTERDVEVARSIFALDNIEIGSHGLAHPMNWRGGETAVVSVPGLDDYRLDGDNEIRESVAYIDQELAPPGKRCEIMLWTGWCNPSEDQLDVAYDLGLRNLNGGDPRMDDHYPSYAHLAPPVHPIGNTFQFYTSAANDFILTDEWNPPYYRFRNVIQTFVNTGAPRRILPVNVYFHFYIARNHAGLSGLRDALDWSVKQDLAPIFASEYVDIVRDFHHARIARPDAKSWQVRKGPALRTIRFDGRVHIDVGRSEGVIGYVYNADLGATYVHLSSAPTALVSLSEQPSPDTYLRDATHDVDNLRASPGSIAFSTDGIGDASFTFANVAPNAAFRIHAAGKAQSDVARSDSKGTLTLRLPLHSPEQIAVTARQVDA